MYSNYVEYLKLNYLLYNIVSKEQAFSRDLWSSTAKLPAAHKHKHPQLFFQ